MIGRLEFGRLMAMACACAGLWLGAARGACAAETIGVDFATYNPVSLVLKDKHWLEDALGPDIAVRWVQSTGSNKALEYLRGNSIVVGSTAGSAALLGRANGAPVKAIYVYGQQEWTALVVRADSPIQGLADLRGKRVAATPGTDPAIFLLRALDSVGLGRADITLVPLQHQDGRLALDRGDVDAWAGLDPFMALAQIQSHDRLLYRNTALVSPGTLLVREDFASGHPEIVAKLLGAYERARRWSLDHHDELVATLAAAAKLPPEVAALQIGRTNLTVSAIGPVQRDRINAAARVLKASGGLAAGADIDRAAAELIDTGFTDRLATD